LDSTAAVIPMVGDPLARRIVARAPFGGFERRKISLARCIGCE